MVRPLSLNERPGTAVDNQCRRRRAWALFCSGMVSAVACNPASAPPTAHGHQPDHQIQIPWPDLTTAEPQVRAKLNEARRRVTENRPDAEAWGRYAIVLDVHDCHPSAAVAYAQAHQLAPDDFRWVYFHGIMVRATHPKKALALFQEAVRLDPGYVPALVRLGILYEILGRPDDAWKAYESARRRDPDNVSARLHYGQMASGRGEVELAVGELQAAVLLAPDDRSALSSLARVLYRSGRTDRANEVAAAARKASLNHIFNDPRYHRTRAEAASVEALITRGRALREAGRFDEALAELQRAHALAPNHPLLCRIIISVHVRRQDYAAAIGAYRSALALKPDDPTLARGLAIALMKLDRYHEAADLLRKTRAVHPKDMAIANELAWLLAVCPELAVRNGAEAVQLAEMVVSTPKHRTAAAIDTLAAAYAETGRYKDAVRTMQEAIQRLGHVSEEDATLARYCRRLQLYRSERPYRIAN